LRKRLEDLAKTGQLSAGEAETLKQLQAAAPANAKNVGAGDATYRGFAAGATFNARDEVASLLGMDGAGIRARDEAAQAAYPDEFGKGKFAGGVAASALPGFGAGKIAQGGGMLAKTLAYGATGLLNGGLSGFMDGNNASGFTGRDLWERIQAAKTPALIGAGLGVAAPWAGAGVGAFARLMANRAKSAGGMSARAVRAVRQPLADSAAAVGDIEAYLKGLGPEAMIADVPGPLQSQAMGLAAMQGRGGAEISKAVNARAVGAGPRIEATMDQNITGPNAAFDLARLRRRLQAVQESRESGRLTVSESEMRELLAQAKDAYREDGLRGRVPYSPDHFRTSDLTGAKVRHFVELPDGRIAHPDELTQARRRGRLNVVPDAELPGAFTTARTAEQLAAPAPAPAPEPTGEGEETQRAIEAMRDAGPVEPQPYSNNTPVQTPAGPKSVGDLTSEWRAKLGKRFGGVSLKWYGSPGDESPQVEVYSAHDGYHGKTKKLVATYQPAGPVDKPERMKQRDAERARRNAEYEAKYAGEESEGIPPEATAAAEQPAPADRPMADPLMGKDAQLDIFGTARRTPRPAKPAVQNSLIPRETERRVEGEETQRAIEAMRDAGNPPEGPHPASVPADVPQGGGQDFYSTLGRDAQRHAVLGRKLATAGALLPVEAVDYATGDGSRHVTAGRAEVVLTNRLGLTAADAKSLLAKIKPATTLTVGGNRKRPGYDVLDLFRAAGKLYEPPAGNNPESGHTPPPPANSPVTGQSGPDTGGEPNGRGQRLSDEVRGGAGGRGGAGVGAGDGPSPGDAPRASGGSPAGEPAPAGGRPGNRGAGGGPGGGRPGGVAAGGGGAGGGPGGRGPAGGAVPPADGPGGGGGPGRANGGGEISRPANAPLTPAPSQPAAGPAGTATAPATTGGNAAANAPLPALMQPTPYGPQAVVSRGGLVVRDGTGGGGDATGGRSHKLGRMATGRVTRIGPPGERPDAPYMPADSLHRLRDQMRSHLPSAERWTADLPTLLGHPDVPDHLKQQAAPVVAQMEYDRAKTADATRHLKNTPPAQMTRSAFADAVAHADPAEFPDGLYGMFFRSGDLPPGGRSRNGQTRELEAGVSTYPLPRATSLAGLADRPWFFGPGRVVGTGSDDEPLIEPVAEKWTKLAGKGADPAAAFYRWLLQNRPDANTPRDPVK
jgi:hypothetical protein